MAVLGGSKGITESLSCLVNPWLTPWLAVPFSGFHPKNPLDCKNSPTASSGPNPAISSVIFIRRGDTCLSFCSGMDRDRNGLDSAGQPWTLLPLRMKTGFMGASRVPSARGWPR